MSGLQGPGLGAAVSGLAGGGAGRDLAPGQGPERTAVSCLISNDRGAPGSWTIP